MDRALEDTIPTFNKKEAGADDGVSLSGGLASLAASGGRTRLEIAVIILVAVVIIGGAELLLSYFKVPQYVLPKPSHSARRVYGCAKDVFLRSIPILPRVSIA